MGMHSVPATAPARPTFKPSHYVFLSALPLEWRTMKEEEDAYRTLFVQHRDSAVLYDPLVRGVQCVCLFVCADARYICSVVTVYRLQCECMCVCCGIWCVVWCVCCVCVSCVLCMCGVMPCAFVALVALRAYGVFSLIAQDTDCELTTTHTPHPLITYRC
jgi:hypothetical protein